MCSGFHLYFYCSLYIVHLPGTAVPSACAYFLATQHDAVGVLTEGLASEDRRQRYYATFLLGQIGAAAKEALPALHRMRDGAASPREKKSYQATIDRIEESIVD